MQVKPVKVGMGYITNTTKNNTQFGVDSNNCKKFF